MSLGKGNSDTYFYSKDGNKVQCRYTYNKNYVFCAFIYMCTQIPGVLIFQFIAPLCFTNAQLFKSRLAAACNVDPEKWNTSTNKEPGCIEVAYHKVTPVVCRWNVCLKQCLHYTNTCNMHRYAQTHTHRHTHIYKYPQ